MTGKLKLRPIPLPLPLTRSLPGNSHSTNTQKTTITVEETTKLNSNDSHTRKNGAALQFKPIISQSLSNNANPPSRTPSKQKNVLKNTKIRRPRANRKPQFCLGINKNTKSSRKHENYKEESFQSYPDSPPRSERDRKRIEPPNTISAINNPKVEDNRAESRKNYGKE